MSYTKPEVNQSRCIEGQLEVLLQPCSRVLLFPWLLHLPKDNIVHLVLRDNVLQAIKDGQFHIHPVSTIEEAMEILTGMRAGWK